MMKDGILVQSDFNERRTTMRALAKDEPQAAFARISQAIHLDWNPHSGAPNALMAERAVHNGRLDVHVFYLNKKGYMLDQTGRWSAIVKGHFPFIGDVPLHFFSKGDDPVQALKVAIFNVALHLSQLLDRRKRGDFSPRKLTEEEAEDMEMARVAIQKIIDGIE